MKLSGTWFTAVILVAFGGAFAGNESADAALLRAAKSGSVEEARAAIQAGADVNAKKEGCHDNKQCYDCYQVPYDPDCGKTPLRFAIDGGNVELVKMFLEEGAYITAKDYDDDPPLHYAAATSGNVEIVEALINAGAGVNARNEDSRTPQEWESRDKDSWTPLMWAARDNENVQVVKALINAGANVNAASKRGWTPLMLAAKNNKNVQVVETLINAGANVKARNEDSWTPLMWAARDNENVQVVKALINAGADVNAASDFGWTPLILAARSNENLEVAETLIQAGATASPEIGNNETVIVKLTSAIESGNTKRIKALIAAGANVNAWAVHCEIYSNHDECLEYARYSRDYSLRYRYDRHDQDDYYRNRDRETLLHFAAKKGNAEVVETLLNAGADKTVRDRDDKTAADYVDRKSSNGTRIYWMLK